MKNPSKISLKIFPIIWNSMALLTLFLCLAALCIDFIFPRQYITTALNDYGKYVGNYDNKFANSFITSFFPEKIQDNFENVKYSYCAQKGDTYAFEAYLEFQIEDPVAFESYIAKNIGDDAIPFKYDLSFKEHSISDMFELVDEEGKNIQYAKIGKILYSKEDRRVIYVAIGVYDGGLVTTDFLCKYFNRFNIDPIEYEQGRSRFGPEDSLRES